MNEQPQYFVTMTLIRDSDRGLYYFAEVYPANNRLDALEQALAEATGLEAFSGYDVHKITIREKGKYNA